MREPRIVVNGRGMAAACCAFLLQRSSLNYSVVRANRIGPSTILASTATQTLYCDIFEDPGLFSSFPAIRKRIVRWGSHPEVVALPHSGVVVSETALLEKLWSKINQDTSAINSEANGVDADWVLHSWREPKRSEEHHFGRRLATAAQAQLLEGADREACWVESVSSGWLFLLPSTGTTGSLIAVGAAANTLLGESRLVAQQIASVGQSTAQFPAYPRIPYPLGGDGWLACGSAAMGFDPLCGEGAGHAAREAILASAILRAVRCRNDSAGMIAHYSSRLLAGFLRHLHTCHQFYSSASTGDWWREELNLLEAGIRWTREHLSHLPAPGYRLVGFDLEPTHIP